MTTQTVHIVTFDYGPSLSSVTLRNLLTDALVATADTCAEVSTDAGVYAAVFGETAVIPAGNYRLRAVVSGAPINRYVTLAGTDGEVVQSAGDASQTTLLATKTAVDSIAVALAGSAPVEPTSATVFEHLESIEGLVTNYISSISAATDASATTIVGFPSSLNIGDSYTDDMSADIHIFLRDSNDDPVTSVGTHGVTDADFAPELTIAQDGQVGRVKATVTWVTASPEGYLKVEIPSSQSRRAAPGVAQMQLVLKWDGAEKALTKQAVTWVARV